MSKTIQTRIQQKHDIEANWIKANNSATPFIPLKGELIIYDVEVDNNGTTLDLTGTGRTTPYTHERFKIGDGKTTVSNLPFADEAAKDYADSVGDTKVPNTRKINNKELSADITLTAADVGAAASSHGTHVSYSTTNPIMAGTASAGSASTVARSDHKHPTDTSRAAASALTSHTGDTTVHITSVERTNWNAAKTHADSAHAPSDAEKNVQADWNVTDTSSDAYIKNKPTIPSGAAASKGVDTSISAASTSTNLPTSEAVAAFVESKGYKTTDNNTTYTFATGDANGQIKVTPSGGTAQNVSVKGLGSAAYTASTAYAAASHGTHVTAATVKSALGTGTGTSKYLREDGTWVTPPDTTYESKTASNGGTTVSLVTTGEKYTWNNKANTTAATQSAAGLMSADDKKKLDGITSGATANKGTVTSVRVQAGTGLASSTSTAQTSTLNTTISIASGYKLPTTTEWNAKANTGDLAAVATSGDYTDLHGAPGIASSSADGLMSATDKANLDTIVNSFNSDDGNATIDTVKEVLKAFENAPEGTNIANALAGKSKVGHTHGVSTKNAAPHTHTHSVTVNGTTGANSGTAVNAVTGYGSFSGGSGGLTTDTTSTNGIKYVESVTHGATSLTGTKTFNTDAIKDVTLSASTSSSDGPGYLASVTHTPASLTGTTTFVSKQGTFSAGTTPVSSASPTNTTTATTANSGDGLVIGAFANGILTISAGTAAPQDHTHNYDKATGIDLTRGTAPSLGAATTGTVGISGGSITTDTKYMKRTLTGASSGTVGISSTEASVTTKYLHHTHTGASLGTASTAAVAPNGHTHSYGSSTALTTGNNSGTAVAAVTSVSPSEE